MMCMTFPNEICMNFITNDDDIMFNTNISPNVRNSSSVHTRPTEFMRITEHKQCYIIFDDSLFKGLKIDGIFIIASANGIMRRRSLSSITSTAKRIVHRLLNEHSFTFFGENLHRHGQGHNDTWCLYKPVNVWSPVKTCSKPVSYGIKIFLIRLCISKHAMIHAF